MPVPFVMLTLHDSNDRLKIARRRTVGTALPESRLIVGRRVPVRDNERRGVGGTLAGRTGCRSLEGMRSLQSKRSPLKGPLSTTAATTRSSHVAVIRPSTNASSSRWATRKQQRARRHPDGPFEYGLRKLGSGETLIVASVVPNISTVRAPGIAWRYAESTGSGASVARGETTIVPCEPHPR